MKKNILVTGGAGFIGSYVNKILHQEGFQTIILDNLVLGHREMVPNGVFIKGNFGDADLLNRLFNDFPIEAVMHFAAFTDIAESVRDPTKYYFNNVVNTFHLLNIMINKNVKYFIFSSSAAVYGVPFETMITEEHRCQPINPYGESKWIVEKMLRDFESAYGLKYCCLRYFNAAGGDPEGKMKNYLSHTSNLIPLLLLRIKNKDHFFKINGTDYSTHDGTCIRDFIHIDDLATAHISALKHLLSDAPSNCYNLGNGKGHSVREVVKAIEQVLDIKLNVQEGPRRPGDPPILVACFKKAANQLFWQPKYTLEEMIKHALLSYELS